MVGPLVSVICLSHNHGKYIGEAVQSILHQTYQNIEIILVDDGSTDDSKDVISRLLKQSKEIRFINIPEPVGNCKAFNKGFRASKGEYLIDLAADDKLLPSRVQMGIESMIKNQSGVDFCDVLHISESGEPIRSQYKRSATHELLEAVPSGDVYELLIRKYFISPPGMMFKREVLEKLNGYDENLLYEDFDFWIRSSRVYTYSFTNEILVEKRDVRHSLSKNQFKIRNKYQRSTLKVCQKILKLNSSKSEDKALKKRVLYEIRQCIKQLNLELIPDFFTLYLKASR